MYEDIIETLKELANENEGIYALGVTGQYTPTYVIMNNDSDDVGGAIEYTLHKVLDEGYDPYEIMNAYIPTPLEWNELNEYEEYIYIDLDYVLGGLIEGITRVA